MAKRVVAITGGIGAGKSVVCRVLAALGYPVYDCDSRARALMDGSDAMKRQIARSVTPDAIAPDGSLDRKALSACVFADPERLSALNSIVHSSVRTDCESWIESQHADTLFVETAILYESGFDSLASEVWEVTAPTELRIGRVMRRSALTRDEILRRMQVQAPAPGESHRLIVNDGRCPLLPQVFNLLQEKNR